MTRKSDTILTEQKANIADRLSLLEQMKCLAYSAREELENGNLDNIGHMLHYSWKLKRQLASKITNPTIDEIYSSARRAGALGGKITGAGGGGFLLLYCPQNKQDAVRNALSQLQELPFHIDQDGVKVIFNYHRSAARLSKDIVQNQLAEQIRMPRIQPVLKTKSPKGNEIQMHKTTLSQYTNEVKQTLDKLPFVEISNVIEILHNARLDQRMVFILGNGGSASTASHFVCDLAKNTKIEGMPDFRVIGLSDNVAVLSAYANDDGYENIFERQLTNLISSGDIVIAISASGNSTNVIKAIEFAKESGATTIGFTGFDGGELGQIVDINLHIPSDSIEQVEDLHLMLEHMITQSLRQAATSISLLEKEQDRYAEFDMEWERGEKYRIEKSSCIQELSESVTSRDTIEWLFGVNRELANQINLMQALETILRVTVERVNATSGSVLIFNNECENVGGYVVYQDGIQSRKPDQLTDILERGLAGWVVENQTAALVPNTNNDSRWLKQEWENTHQVSRSAICAPLHMHGHLIGVLTVVSSNGNQYSNKELAQLSAVAFCISILGANFNVLSLSRIETAGLNV
jgi:D-sedoheptulose 7-phosphate isomerase